MKAYPKGSGQEKERILVVDDEKDVVEFCLKVLALKGYKAQGTSSGLEALELARQGRYDLLLTDIMMPEISGLDLLAEIRATTPDITAVIITGYGTTDMAIKALRAGARGFVTKPFAIEDLTAAIEHALREIRLLRENIRLKALVPVFEASQRFRSTVKLEQLLTEVLETTAREAGADCGGLLLIHGGDLDPRTTVGCGGQPEAMVDVCRMLLPFLKDETEAFGVSRDFEACPGVRQPLVSLGVSFLLCFPLRVQGRDLGLLALAKSNGRRPFDEGDVEVISILGNQAAVAIESARLFEELVQAQRQLEKWNRELEERVEERTRELRKAQEHLVRAEKLAVIGKIGAGVAHELRNPLGVISNSVYYLGLKEKDADPKVRRHLDIMRREIARSNRIIADLMSFVRVGEVGDEMVDINDLVEEAASRVEIPSAMTVETSLQEDLPAVVADPGRIQQVFVNLLTNAVQAMSDKGKLSIATRLADGFVEIVFRDTGCGINPEDEGRLFEPLFTTKAKGTGLGLAISRMLIENHGGHISAYNNADVGAAFVVALPTESKDETKRNRS